MFRPEVRMFYQTLRIQMSKKKTLTINHVVAEKGNVLKSKKVGIEFKRRDNQRSIAVVFYGRGLFISYRNKKKDVLENCQEKQRLIKERRKEEIRKYASVYIKEEVENQLRH